MPSNRRNTSDLFLTTIYGKYQLPTEQSDDSPDTITIQNPDTNYEVISDITNTNMEQQTFDICGQYIEKKHNDTKSCQSDHTVDDKSTQTTMDMSFSYENEINDCLEFIEKLKTKYKIKKEEVIDLKKMVDQLNEEKENKIKEEKIKLDQIQQQRMNLQMENIQLKTRLDREAQAINNNSQKNLIFRTFPKKNRPGTI